MITLDINQTPDVVTVLCLLYTRPPYLVLCSCKHNTLSIHMHVHLIVIHNLIHHSMPQFQTFFDKLT